MQDESVQLPEGIVLYPWYTFVIVLASFPGHVVGGLGMRLALCCFHHDGELNFFFSPQMMKGTLILNPESLLV